MCRICRRLGRAAALVSVILCTGIAWSAPAGAPRSALILYPPVGNPRACGTARSGPGLVLMGGGPDVDAAFLWIHHVLAGSANRRAGRLIVLRASGGNDYTPYISGLARFCSVQTLVIKPDAGSDDLTAASAYVDRADAVFFAGGDQANYVRWKGTALTAAVQRLYDRGGIVGGTSAGLAILGEYAYDSVAADRTGPDVEVTSANALANPDEPIISFTHDLFRFPPLRHIITDTHFVARNRLGRLIVFLARLAPGSRHRLMGLGVNEATAIVINRHGIGRLLVQRPTGCAFLVRLTRPAILRPGRPFVARGIRITRLDKPGQTVDLQTGTAPGAATYTIGIDGRTRPWYVPPDPYHVPHRI
jgi:cyanophycinase